MDENQIEEFEEEIGMRFNPEKEALKALQEHQEASGIVFDHPDAPVGPDAKGAALADDEELGSYLGDPRRGRR